MDVIKNLDIIKQKYNLSNNELNKLITDGLLIKKNKTNIYCDKLPIFITSDFVLNAVSSQVSYLEKNKMSVLLRQFVSGVLDTLYQIKPNAQNTELLKFLELYFIVPHTILNLNKLYDSNLSFPNNSIFTKIKSWFYGNSETCSVNIEIKPKYNTLDTVIELLDKLFSNNVVILDYDAITVTIQPAINKFENYYRIAYNWLSQLKINFAARNKNNNVGNFVVACIVTKLCEYSGIERLDCGYVMDFLKIINDCINFDNCYDFDCCVGYIISDKDKLFSYCCDEIFKDYGLVDFDLLNNDYDLIVAQEQKMLDKLIIDYCDPFNSLIWKRKQLAIKNNYKYVDNQLCRDTKIVHFDLLIEPVGEFWIELLVFVRMLQKIYGCDMHEKIIMQILNYDIKLLESVRLLGDFVNCDLCFVYYKNAVYVGGVYGEKN